MSRETAEVIEQLMSQQNFPVMLYELQLIDRGLGSFSGMILTDTTKSWLDSEWATTTAIVTDVDGQRFTVSANDVTTITVISGGLTPVDGEYSVERWFHITSHLENLDAEGKPDSFDYGTDEFGRVKSYLPYPINHKMLHDHELGRFPQLQVTVLNPGEELFSEYYNLDTVQFDFYALFERYSALRGNVMNIIVAFLDADGELVTSPTDVNITNQFTIIKSDVSKDKLVFSVTSLGNFNEKKIPARTFSKATCGWVYKGDECAYTSSDPTLTGTITRCNKLFKSNVFYREKEILELTPVVGQQYNFTLPDGLTIPSDMESHVLGSIVECTKINYLWRVTAIVNESTITIKSYGNAVLLLDQINSITERVTVNIYEKECCYGHADTGTIYTDSSYKQFKNYIGFCKHNDLVFNGDFNTLGLYGGALEPIVWAPVGDLYVHKSYAFGTGATTLVQPCYVAGYPATNIPIETGKKFMFIIRYYGANTVDDSTDRYLTYTIRASIGGTTRYWDTAAGALTSAPTANQVLLRPYNERLGIADFDITQKEDVRFVLFDEIVTIVDLQIASLQTEVALFNIQIQTEGDTEIIYNYIALIMYNQFERFGGFPAIPTSRYWFF